MTNATANNSGWTATDHATHKASIWASRSFYNTLIDAGWELTNCIDKQDQLGVMISMTFEFLSPEGAKMRIIVEEQQSATEARQY